MKSLLLAFLLFCVAVSHAQQPGSLDPSFATKGLAVSTSLSDALLFSLKIANDGRLICGAFGPYKQFSSTFQINAFLPDGSPDLSFGEKGNAYIVFPEMKKATDFASLASIALLPDGKILASGYLEASGTKNDIAFAQFKQDGTIDSTFGSNGTVTTTFGYSSESAGNLTVQPDGKFIIGGEAVTNIFQGSYKLFTARFLSDGSKDVSYGNGGMVLSSVSGAATSIQLQKDGKIVVAGYSGSTFQYDAAFLIERYNPDGSYDNSFDVNGIVSTKIDGKPCFINDAVIQADGKIIVTGRTGGLDEEPLLTVARYNSNGSLDNSFGKEGFVSTPLPEYGGEGKKVFITGEKADKIVVAGINVSDFSSYENFALTGYNMDGTLNNEFGNEGIQITDLGGLDEITSAAIQTDGKIVVAGYMQSLETFEQYRALARYFGYPTHVSLAVRIKRFIHNHSIIWNGLPADDHIAYYSVEQSSLSTKGFTPIAKLSGRSNLHDYSLNNSNLLQGTNYYRVKAISTDGVVRYSEVGSADNIANTASVFPNPAKSYVTVQGLATDATANISIKDGSGTVLTRGTSSGSKQYRLSVNNLLPGTYYLNITTAGMTETLRFVKE